MLTGEYMEPKKYMSLSELMADPDLWGGDPVTFRGLSDLTHVRTGHRVSKHTLWAIAAGKRRPSHRTLEIIARTAGVHLCSYFSSAPCFEAPHSPATGTPDDTDNSAPP